MKLILLTKAHNLALILLQACWVEKSDREDRKK